MEEGTSDLEDNVEEIDRSVKIIMMMMLNLKDPGTEHPGNLGSYEKTIPINSKYRERRRNPGKGMENISTVS